MVGHVLQLHPHWMTLPPPGPLNATYTVPWFVTTILLSGVGFFMGPANAPAIYSARSGETLRRNMIFMPLYQLVLLFVFFAGFTALAVVPGMKGPAADQSFMLLIQRYYSAPVLGIIASAGCLAALLPASTLLLGAASVFSKNVLGDALNIATGRSRTHVGNAHTRTGRGVLGPRALDFLQNLARRSAAVLLRRNNAARARRDLRADLAAGQRMGGRRRAARGRVRRFLFVAQYHSAGRNQRRLLRLVINVAICALLTIVIKN